MALFVADVRDTVTAMLGNAGPGKLAMLCKPDIELSNMALRKANAQLLRSISRLREDALHCEE